jgi:transcriptional regulator with XRE-family HTH domain
MRTGDRLERALETDPQELAAAVGRALRRARRSRGMTLRTAASRSGGTFKASALGAYERGERRISIERFSALASLYGVPADRLLAQALALVDPSGHRSLVVDLTRIERVPAPDREFLAEFVHQVRDLRHDLLSNVITLRAGDVRSLASSIGVTADDLLTRLGPAVQASRPEEHARPPLGQQ